MDDDLNPIGKKTVFVVIFRDEDEDTNDVSCVCFTLEKAREIVRQKNLALKADGYDYFTEEGDFDRDRAETEYPCYYYYDSGYLIK